ncbi:Putative lipoprotein [Candidatus Sodalis pierantonius str. SOPE]|uniref:Putative lipoprotein n=1 Tax=Candidatus Sodalis pierantonii str. SOPE TaxID=2342 RepID=W0HQF7_9GAMM|nr:Putative lipoprotein [Candidatus Sodalis pierantonius str. SOPE]
MENDNENTLSADARRYSASRCLPAAPVMTSWRPKDGQMILTDGKPEIDKTTGLIRYTDERGNERQINGNDVSQIIER